MTKIKICLVLEADITHYGSLDHFLLALENNIGRMTRVHEVKAMAAFSSTKKLEEAVALIVAPPVVQKIPPARSLKRIQCELSAAKDMLRVSRKIFREHIAGRGKQTLEQKREDIFKYAERADLLAVELRNYYITNSP